MHIVNIMLSAASGGLEQSAVDYAEALTGRAFKVTSVIDEDCAYKEAFRTVSAKVYRTENKGAWDVFAARRLRQLLSAVEPDVIITHGNRAFTMALTAGLKNVPVVTVTHNSRIKPLKRADAVFAVTHAMHSHALRQGVQPERLYYIPNIARVAMQPPEFKHYNEPPVIGFMGRLAPEKGADVLLNAAHILKTDPGFPDFRVMIGGDGPERKKLSAQVVKLGLEKEVVFKGWIDDKDNFLRNCDIFCLPSRRETFGISLVEAMGAGLPCIASDCEGPSEIIRHSVNGYLTHAGTAENIAETVHALYKKDPAEIREIAMQAFLTASEYSLSNVGSALQAALTEINGRRKHYYTGAGNRPA